MAPVGGCCSPPHHQHHRQLLRELPLTAAMLPPVTRGTHCSCPLPTSQTGDSGVRSRQGLVAPLLLLGLWCLGAECLEQCGKACFSPWILGHEELAGSICSFPPPLVYGMSGSSCLQTRVTLVSGKHRQPFPKAPLLLVPRKT